MLCVCVCLSTIIFINLNLYNFLTCCFCKVSLFAYFSSFLPLFFLINIVSLGVTITGSSLWDKCAVGQYFSICSCNIYADLTGDGC